MQEPSLRTSRLAIAGGIAAIVAVGGAGFLLGRATSPRPPEPAPTALATPSPEPTPEPVRMLDRAELVALAAAASDAQASGAPLPQKVRDAVNRRFELILPFGCTGPAEAGGTAALRWRYDEEEEALRLYASPSSWRAEDWGMGENAGVEAIEGFWAARPWSSSEDCPPRGEPTMPSGMEAITLPGQTLAVAQFFTANSRRSALRDGRPFETVLRMPRDRLDVSRGFRLRLSGRIDRVPGGGPLRCIQPGGMEQRPICVVAVTLDEVRIENPVNDEVLATWMIGGD